MNYLGDYPTGATVRIPLNTFDKDDGSSITLTGNATGDIEVFKNGGTTERASDNGYTFTVDFDSRTGLHIVVIDTSDNSDSGFYAAGNEYQVAIDSVTVDGVTVRAWIGCFSIERSGGALAILKDATYGLSALETLVDDLESRLTATRAGYLDNLNTGVSLVDNAITAAKINDGAITAAKFASGALDAVWSTAARTLTAATNITAGIATAVWAEGTRTLTAATNITAGIATAVWGEATRTLTAATNITAGIATAVWAELTSALTTVGSIGKFLLDKITRSDALIEDSSGDRFTAKALEAAPAGAATLSAADAEQIRYRLLLDGTQTQPTTTPGYPVAQEETPLQIKNAMSGLASKQKKSLSSFINIGFLDGTQADPLTITGITLTEGQFLEIAAENQDTNEWKRLYYKDGTGAWAKDAGFDAVLTKDNLIGFCGGYNSPATGFPGGTLTITINDGGVNDGQQLPPIIVPPWVAPTGYSSSNGPCYNSLFNGLPVNIESYGATVKAGDVSTSLDAAAIRSALGMSSANLDSQLDALPTAAEIVTAVLAGVVEGSLTLVQAQRIMLAALAGLSNGGGTAAANFRDQADTKNRITATVDANGNRTAITVDGA